MEDKHFREDLRGGIKRIINEGIFTTEDNAFVYWVLTEIFGLDADDAEDACSIAGKNDKGIDAYYTDQEEQSFNIVQGKYFRRTKRLGPEYVRPISSSLNWLKNPTPEVRQEVKDASQEYLDAIDKQYKVKILVVATGALTDDAEREAAQARTQIPESHELEIYDFLRLKDRYETSLSKRKEKAPDVLLHLDAGEYYESSALGAVVADIRARQIAEIIRKYKAAVVQENVRHYLGKSRPVNKRIANTLQDLSGDKANFWYYNLGLSALCEDYQLDQAQHSLSVTSFRIANGCQTAWVLYENEPLLDDSVGVQIRIMKTRGMSEQDKKDFANKITWRNNDQTAVKGRDLRSNDPEQIRLQREFDQLLSPWFFEIKEGEWRNVSKDRRKRRRYEGRIINNYVAGQARLCFLGQPAEAKVRKAAIFEESAQGGFFDKVFGPSTRPFDLLLAYMLYQKIRDEERAFKKRFRQAERENFASLTEEQKDSLLQDQFLMYASNHLLAIMGQMIAAKYGSMSSEEIHSIIQRPDVASRLYEVTKDWLRIAVLRMKQSEESQGRTFSYTSSFKAIGTMSDIKRELQFDIRHRQLLDTLPPL